MEVERSLFRESVKGNPLGHLTTPGELCVYVCPVASQPCTGLCSHHNFSGTSVKDGYLEGDILLVLTSAIVVVLSRLPGTNANVKIYT